MGLQDFKDNMDPTLFAVAIVLAFVGLGAIVLQATSCIGG